MTLDICNLKIWILSLQSFEIVVLMLKSFLQLHRGPPNGYIQGVNVSLDDTDGCRQLDICSRCLCHHRVVLRLAHRCMYTNIVMVLESKWPRIPLCFCSRYCQQLLTLAIAGSVLSHTSYLKCFLCRTEGIYILILLSAHLNIRVGKMRYSSDEV